jgi:hypothetical protein
MPFSSLKHFIHSSINFLEKVKGTVRLKAFKRLNQRGADYRGLFPPVRVI